MLLRVVDDFLDAADLEAFRKLVEGRSRQHVAEMPHVASAFWTKYAERFPGFTGILPQVTLTCTQRPIVRHVDRRYANERAKLLIYLNDVPSGGTVFYRENYPAETVSNRANRLVQFDIQLPHESEAFPPRATKLAIGFRLV